MLSKAAVRKATTTIFWRTVWLAKGTSIALGFAVMVALVAGVATTALAANGNNFVLGVLNNSATAVTKLTGNVDGPALQIVNKNVAANDTALDLRVQAGEAPMRVNSPARVTNLNADLVDGLSSEQLRGAYAMVMPGTAPIFDTSRTSGFSSVSRLSTGVYCLEPASGFQVRGRAVAVSVDWTTTQDPEGNATAMIAGDCGTNGLRIVTERSHNAQDGFLLADQADNIGFHVVVP